MTNISQIKKDVETIHRALNVKEDENEQGKLITRLLREYEELNLSPEEQHEDAKNVVKQLKEEGFFDNYGCSSAKES